MFQGWGKIDSLYIFVTFKLSSNEVWDHVIFSLPQTAAGGDKTEGSNTIMSTSFALKFWSNKIINVDIILSSTLTVS